MECFVCKHRTEAVELNGVGVFVSSSFLFHNVETRIIHRRGKPHILPTTTATLPTTTTTLATTTTITTTLHTTTTTLHTLLPVLIPFPIPFSHPRAAFGRFAHARRNEEKGALKVHTFL